MNCNRIFFIISGYLAVMISNTSLAYATESTQTTYQRPSTVSATLPAYYPSHFPALGVLTELRGQYDWVIDGKAVKVSSNIIVHSLVTNFSSLYSIKQGMDLAYRKNKQGEISEVWQLPERSVKRN